MAGSFDWAVDYNLSQVAGSVGAETMPRSRLERLIERTKASYYETLHRASQGWHEAAHDPMPWVAYFLGVVKAAYDESARDAGSLRDGREAKTELVRQAISQTSAAPAWAGTCCATRSGRNAMPAGWRPPAAVGGHDGGVSPEDRTTGIPARREKGGNDGYVYTPFSGYYPFSECPRASGASA